MLSRKLLKHYSVLGRQDGIAMLTVLMLTIILTVIGIAAISTTTMDMRMAGGERMREASVSAGEACLSSAAYIIQQVVANSAVPAAMIGPATNPVIAVNQAGLGPAANSLVEEVRGDNGPDAARTLAERDVADPNAVLVLPQVFMPNAVLFVPTFAAQSFIVNMDIDRLYIHHPPGEDATSGGEIVYRITCFPRVATPPAAPLGMALGTVSAIYACRLKPDTCQPKL